MLPLSPSKKKELVKAARIFTKEPISKYHQRLNDEAGKIVLSDPSLITRHGGRGELLDRARAAAHNSGYSYKKGKSRSKHSVTEGSDAEEVSTVRKRVKIDAEMREQRIKVLNEDIEGLNKQITYKQKRLEQAELMKRYDQCDTLSKEMLELKQERRTLENELTTYKHKERKAQWYQQRRKVQRNGSKSKPANPPANSSDESEVSPKSPRSTRSSTVRASRSRSASCDVASTSDSPDKPVPTSDTEVLSEEEQNLSPGLLTSQN